MATVADVINWTRMEVLDDADPLKYLWSDTELIHHLNRCYNELIKAALPQKDQSTVAITQIKLLSNVGLYALDARVIQVETARLKSDTTFGPLNKTTENRLNGTVSNWRDETGTPREYAPGAASGYLSIYPKFDKTYEVVASSVVTFNGNTISLAGGNFSAFIAGDSINISGTLLNNGYVTVATAGTASFTVVETLVAESHIATFRKVVDTLLMTVSRLPSVRWTVQDITDETQITEIRDDHCDGFTDGIAKRAFLKPDTYTYYPQKAAYHKGEFDEWKKEVRRDMILLNRPDKSRVPRSGSSIYY